MISWQKILREETFSSDFELIEDNDKYIIDGVRASYKANLTANSEQLKEILDGAYKAGFKLAKRRYTAKTVYVLVKYYKNACCIFQFSIQPDVLMVCEVAYGIGGDALSPTAKKSKYFATIFNQFDKNLPLEFMNTNINKETLLNDIFIQIKDEYIWYEYFDYIYSFMLYMLEQLNGDSELFLEESLQEEKVLEDEKTEITEFIKSLESYNENIKVELKINKIINEYVINILWEDDYDNQNDEVKESLNIIITNFLDSIKDDVSDIESQRARTKIKFNRTLFIKY